MSAPVQHLFQHHGLTIVIGALAVGLLGVIGYEARWGTSALETPVTARAQVATSGETSLLPSFALPTLEAGFKQIVDRPLFLPTRRPVPVATGLGQPVMKKGQFRLAGTIVNQELPYAFLVEIATGKGIRVAKGADVMSTGILVATVDAARVVLKQGDESEELTLRTASSPPPPPSAPLMPTPATAAGAPAAAMRPPPPGAVVGGIPSAPVPRGTDPTVPLPGMAVLPGFVQSPAAAAPATTNALPAGAPDPNIGAQRRRRFPNVPQQ